MGLFDKIRSVIGSKIIKPSLPKFSPDILKKMDIRIPGRNHPDFHKVLPSGGAELSKLTAKKI